MIDANMSFAHVESGRGKRLAPLVGLGIGAMVSAGLWALLVIAAIRLV